MRFTKDKLERDRAATWRDDSKGRLWYEWRLQTRWHILTLRIRFRETICLQERRRAKGHAKPATAILVFARNPLVKRTSSAQCQMGVLLRVLVIASFRLASVPLIVDCLHFCFTNGLSFCSAQVRAVKSGKVFILCYHFASRKLIYLQHFSLLLQNLLQICLRDQFRAIYLEAPFKSDSTILLKNIFKNLVTVDVIYFFSYRNFFSYLTLP